MQHCCVEVVAHSEEFGSIDTVIRIKRKTSGLHGPLDRRAGDMTGACGVRDGELGHGRG